MRHGRREVLLTLAVASLLLLAPTAVLGQANGALDLGSLLRERDPEAMLGGLKDDMQAKVKGRWIQLVLEDSRIAASRNQSTATPRLYPNPSLQAYVNRLGQSLIPKEASDNIYVSFKILEDPLAYADTVSTGTVYLSTGMISLLDNESQLAFVLMHEAGHFVLSHNLYQFIEEAKAEKRANGIRLIGTVAGAVAGGLTGGMMGGKKDAAAGAAIGAVVGLAGAEITEAVRRHRYLKEIQIEADQFAAQVLLQHGFDAREAPALMVKVGKILHRSGVAAELAFGDAIDLPQRSEKIKNLLGGSYQPVVARILSGNGFRMSSPRYSQLMAELKRDNGLLALERDLFVIARTNLEEAAAVRTDDPLTMYGLGMLYRTVGRTDEDVARAASYLKSAMEFDEVRHRFPESYLQYAVELLSREDPKRYPDIQRALRSYVVLYQRKSGGELPPEMPFVYDYLDLTGDRSWIAYKVNNVSSDAPYQLTGDAKIDGSFQPAEKRSSRKP
jgi:Zn-dependent protease with chaperone function